MDEIDAFLAAIAAAPAGPLPRLAYADWLDEHGEPEYAELIRVWTEIERHTQPPAERTALRQRRHHLTTVLQDRWRFDRFGGQVRHSLGRGVLSGSLHLDARGLVRTWAEWPSVLRFRHLLVRDYFGHEQAIADCPYLTRVERLALIEFVAYTDDGPPYLPASDPMLRALEGSPHLGRLSVLEFHDVWPSRAGLLRFADSTLCRRLSGFRFVCDADPGGRPPIRIQAERPPDDAIRDAIHAFLDEFSPLVVGG